MLEFFFMFTIVFFMAFLFVALICVPIMIADARGITGGSKLMITILSWCGIFFGVTWFIALILSLVLTGDNLYYATDNLDKLEKLSKLYKEKVITKDEYEKMKAKLLG